MRERRSRFRFTQVGRRTPILRSQVVNLVGVITREHLPFFHMIAETGAYAARITEIDVSRRYLKWIYFPLRRHRLGPPGFHFVKKIGFGIKIGMIIADLE